MSYANFSYLFRFSKEIVNYFYFLFINFLFVYLYFITTIGIFTTTAKKDSGAGGIRSDRVIPGGMNGHEKDRIL